MSWWGKSLQLSVPFGVVLAVVALFVDSGGLPAVSQGEWAFLDSVVVRVSLPLPSLLSTQLRLHPYDLWMSFM